MKNIVKRFWPLLAVGLLAAGILTGLLIYNARSTPQRAVEGYLRASLQYDADGLIKYASEYQLTLLKGNDPEMDTDTLRKTLRAGYEQADDYREKGKITFQSEVGELILPGNAEFDKLLENYAFKADPSAAESFTLVTAHCYVDGKLHRTYFVYAVQCNHKWYYGFTA